MTKYKWSLLGLIISVILFVIFLISPLINFINGAIIPAEPIPKYFGSSNTIVIYLEGKGEAYEEWHKNVPKKLNQHALREFIKSFYHWNLFWIPIIVFYFMTFNYKKSNK